MNPTTGVLAEAWELYKAHWRHFVAISLIVYLVVSLVTAVSVALSPVAGALIASIVTVVGLFWVQGALVKAVDDVRDGRVDLSLQETFQQVAPKLGAIAIAGILAGIGIGFGLVLFIVPGLILMTLWVVITPAIVLEDAGALASFGRSRDLVRGYGFPVFGVIVLTILVLIAFSIVFGLILIPLPQALQSFISNVVSGALTAPFIASTYTLLYYRLREAHSRAPA